MATTPKASFKKEQLSCASTPFPNRPPLAISDVSPINKSQGSDDGSKRKPDHQDSSNLKRKALQSTYQTKHLIKNSSVVSSCAMPSSLAELYVVSSDEEEEIKNTSKKLKTNVNKVDKTTKIKKDVKKGQKEEFQQPSKDWKKKPNKLKRNGLKNDTSLNEIAEEIQEMGEDISVKETSDEGKKNSRTGIRSKYKSVKNTVNDKKSNVELIEESLEKEIKVNVSLGKTDIQKTSNEAVINVHQQFNENGINKENTVIMNKVRVKAASKKRKENKGRKRKKIGDGCEFVTDNNEKAKECVSITCKNDDTNETVSQHLTKKSKILQKRKPRVLKRNCKNNNQSFTSMKNGETEFVLKTDKDLASVSKENNLLESSVTIVHGNQLSDFPKCNRKSVRTKPMNKDETVVCIEQSTHNKIINNSTVILSKKTESNPLEVIKEGDKTVIKFHDHGEDLIKSPERYIEDDNEKNITHNISGKKLLKTANEFLTKRVDVNLKIDNEMEIKNSKNEKPEIDFYDADPVLLNNSVRDEIIEHSTSTVKENEIPSAAVRETRTQRSRRTKPSNCDDQSVPSSEDHLQKKSSGDNELEGSSTVPCIVSSNNGTKTVAKNKETKGDDSAKNNVEIDELNVLKDKVENDSELVYQRLTRTKTNRNCKRNVSDTDDIEIQNLEQRVKRSKKSNIEKNNLNNIAVKSIGDAAIKECYVELSQKVNLMNNGSVIKNNDGKQLPENSAFKPHEDTEKQTQDTYKKQLNIIGNEESLATSNKITVSEVIQKVNTAAATSSDDKVDDCVVMKTEINSIPSSSDCTESNKINLVSSTNLHTEKEICKNKPKTRSRENNDNFIKLPCQCQKKIQCFGPYSDGSYASKRILGKGVEIQKCLKHEKSLMAGFIRIHGDSSMSGKATNNTVYMVMEGMIRANISGNVKNLKTNDWFMVVENAIYEIRNTTCETVQLSFMKTSRKLL
ncbi:uncharacterized protein LOC142319533 isoform X2 [Lycorma delicatula]|uniref:uncharacterized protein LOC142319533 isoform X2 n=1 Tax=Lycorma delicatula TaxID=130591 RepID=UPI003F50EE09